MLNYQRVNVNVDAYPMLTIPQALPHSSMIFQLMEDERDFPFPFAYSTRPLGAKGSSEYCHSLSCEAKCQIDVH